MIVLRQYRLNPEFNRHVENDVSEWAYCCDIEWWFNRPTHFYLKGYLNTGRLHVGTMRAVGEWTPGHYGWRVWAKSAMRDFANLANEFVFTSNTANA